MTALIGSFPARQQSSVFCFSVAASADPSVIPRLAAVFSQLGLVPDRWYSSRDGEHAEMLSIDVQLSGVDGAQADHLAATMRRIILVESVLMYERPRNTEKTGHMLNAG